jgi:two-component system torCAD operon response regulator TorR
MDCNRLFRILAFLSPSTLEDSLLSAQILIVEDDEFVRRLMAAYLAGNGYSVSEAESGEEMFRRMTAKAPDLILLDLGLPDEDGIVLARQLRARSSIPVIVITARNKREDRLAALSVGADDYLVKPVDPEELVLRVRNVLRRLKPADEIRRSESPRVFRFSGFALDQEFRTLLSPSQVEIKLTAGEFALLLRLAKSPGRVFSRAELLDTVSTSDGSGSERVVDVLIGRIRKKVEPDPKNPQMITTVRSLGYKLEKRGSI